MIEIYQVMSTDETRSVVVIYEHLIYLDSTQRIMNKGKL